MVADGCNLKITVCDLKLAWDKFLAAAAVDEDLEKLAMEHPVLKQAKDALDRLSADPQARERAEQREMALHSYELDLAKVRREGRAEGKAELLRDLLAQKFGELPPHAIERVASATQAELQRWSKRVLSAESLDAVFQV